MNELSKWSKFKTAYAAGRQEIENRQRPLSPAATIALSFLLIVVLIFAWEINGLLAIRFSLSAFEKYALDMLDEGLLFAIFFAWLWRVRIKRTR
jgi:hypothetical protein